MVALPEEHSLGLVRSNTSNLYCFLQGEFGVDCANSSAFTKRPFFRAFDTTEGSQHCKLHRRAALAGDREGWSSAPCATFSLQLS